MSKRNRIGLAMLLVGLALVISTGDSQIIGHYVSFGIMGSGSYLLAT